jgi:hypothetical protein
MSPNEWAGLSVAVITIVTSFIAAVRWLVKHYLSELKPDKNGQHNLEGRICRIENKLDTLYEILITKN